MKERLYHFYIDELVHREWLTVERPLCSCHGKPMHHNGVRPNGTAKWRCSVKNQDRITARKLSDGELAEKDAATQRLMSKEDPFTCEQCGYFVPDAESRLREVEAERNELHGRWRNEADAHTDSLNRADRAEAERDDLRRGIGSVHTESKRNLERAEKAEAERDEWEKRALKMQDVAQRHIERGRRMEAENERLREALRLLASDDQGWAASNHQPPRLIARAALEGK